MRCDDVRRYVSPYLDSELDPRTSFDIASHLDRCAPCRDRFEKERDLETRLAEQFRRPEAGDDKLWQRALARTSLRRRLRILRIVGLAAAALVAILLWPSGPGRFPDHLRADYRRCLQGGVPMDVPPQPAELEKFLREAGLASLRLPKDAVILGGRHCSIGGANLAMLLCRFQGELVHLCVVPEGLLPEMGAGERMTDDRDGIPVMAVRIGDRVLCAVSRLPPDSLSQLLRVS